MRGFLGDYQVACEKVPQYLSLLSTPFLPIICFVHNRKQTSHLDASIISSVECTDENATTFGTLKDDMGLTTGAIVETKMERISVDTLPRY